MIWKIASELASPAIAGIAFLLLLRPLGEFARILFAKKRLKEYVVPLFVFMALLILEIYLFLTVYIYWEKALGINRGWIMSLAKIRTATLNIGALFVALWARKNQEYLIRMVEKCSDTD